MLQRSRTQPTRSSVADAASRSLDVAAPCEAPEPSRTCTLHVLDTKRAAPRHVPCVIGQDVSHQTYEQHRDSNGDLFGFVYYENEKPLLQVVPKDRWVAARQQVEASTPVEQEVAFYCAKDSSRFSVLFARDAESGKFRIRSIEGPAARAPKADGFAWRRGMRSKSNDGDGKLECSTLSANELDLAGWQCACCKYRPWPPFVKCPKCGRLVCGSKVVAIQNGPKTFVCAPDCGNSGIVEKEIMTYEAAARRVDDSHDVPAATRLSKIEPANQLPPTGSQPERPLVPRLPKHD